MDSPTKKKVCPKLHPYTYYTNYPSIKLQRQANQKYPNTYKSLQAQPETLIESDPAIKQELNKNPKTQKRKHCLHFLIFQIFFSNFTQLWLSLFFGQILIANQPSWYWNWKSKPLLKIWILSTYLQDKTTGGSRWHCLPRRHQYIKHKNNMHNCDHFKPKFLFISFNPISQ